MYVKVCPFCKCKFYSATKNSPTYHFDCEYKMSGKNKTQEVPLRTSTPMPQTESITSNFSDSVIDFFYQTWKSGLCSETGTVDPSPKSKNDWQAVAMQQHPVSVPFYYASSQVFYVNTIVCQSIVPAVYLQPVGYRPDGTFGVLPFYWPCIVQ